MQRGRDDARAEAGDVLLSLKLEARAGRDGPLGTGRKSRASLRQGSDGMRTAAIQAAGRRQKGFTITRMTMNAVTIPGTSFISRKALPLTGRSPRASFLP
jgi:hypothetical protein